METEQHTQQGEDFRQFAIRENRRQETVSNRGIENVALREARPWGQLPAEKATSNDLTRMVNDGDGV